MDRETIQHVFDPFYTTKEVSKGTGLGLATVYGIVKQNRGFINVYSELDKGTTFKIYLPRYKGSGVEKTIKEEIISPIGTETVLVVEDDEQILKLSQKILERQGYTILSARVPGEAIVLCEKYADEIHLLITDVVMPGMNGKELMERIEKLKPGIKILFMSGYTADIIAKRGVLSKGINFIQKPFLPKSLGMKVREALDS